ncbi:MAG: Zn-dependent alcohol dehydrogenase [Candidatus Dormibacteria bacterium]|jgi:S-(hydroxymethyl)glutathione dehydrogenase/alcohol dehydrogenase
MQAAVQRSIPGTPEVVEVSIDQPGPREVLIKTVAAGLCRSDLSFIRGLLPSYAETPFVAGHEGAGIVLATGSGVTSVAPGDLVVAALSAFCGHCKYCLTGHANICFAPETVRAATDRPRLSFEGKAAAQCWNVSAFAEMMLVHESQAVRIPADVPGEVAPILGCAVVTGMGAALRTAQVRTGETVAVFGCGGVGINAIQGSRIAGARRIIAVDRLPAKLELARAFGATDGVVAGPDTAASVIELSGGGVDQAIEVIGTTETCQQAIASTRRGGTVTIVGMIPESERVSISEFDLTAEKHIQGCDMGSNLPPLDIPFYCELYRQGRLKLDEQISRTLRLDQLMEGFEALDSGEVTRTVVVFD